MNIKKFLNILKLKRSFQMAYDSYSKHPAHQTIVEYRWKKEVKRFLEIDFRVHDE